jgi:hypothetical protein
MVPVREPMIEERIIRGLGAIGGEIWYYVHQLVKFLPHFWAMHARKDRAKGQAKKAKQRQLQGKERTYRALFKGNDAGL